MEWWSYLLFSAPCALVIIMLITGLLEPAYVGEAKRIKSDIPAPEIYSVPIGSHSWRAWIRDSDMNEVRAGPAARRRAENAVRDRWYQETPSCSIETAIERIEKAQVAIGTLRAEKEALENEVKALPTPEKTGESLAEIDRLLEEIIKSREEGDQIINQITILNEQREATQALIPKKKGALRHSLDKKYECKCIHCGEAANSDGHLRLRMEHRWG